MRFIVLDTADARGSVALFEDANPLCVESHLGDEDYSSWLLPAVKRTLDAFSLSLAKLDGYAVCAGPGSFTGLRVGLTAVKAWGEIFSKPIAALSRLQALASGPSAEQGPFRATFIDARRNQVFAALYASSRDDYELQGEESVTSLADFIARVEAETAGESVCWRSPDVELLQSQPVWQTLSARGHVSEHIEPPFAARLGELAYRKFQRRETTDAISLDANYVRRSDAEVFWKGNKAALKA
jgi:tRNA threonylcarbamoyladenosine biosynthesis protein TsaB